MMGLWLATLAHGATCTVTNADSAGPGSLRACINDLQANGTPDDVIDVANGPHVIAVGAATGSPLPDLTDDGLTILGAGQLALDGSNVTSGNGFTVVGAQGVTLEGMEIYGFPGAGVDVRGAPSTTVGGASSAAENAIYGNDKAGVRVGPDGAADSAGTTVAGNRVGLRLDDTADGNCVAPGSFDCAGVLVASGAGAVGVSDNVVSSNLAEGVRVHSSGATVTSNAIGVGAAGDTARPNLGDGVLVAGTGSTDVVDGVQLGSNVVAANGGHGIHLAGWSANAVVSANGVGVDLMGNPMGNDADGIHVVSTASGHAITGSVLLPAVVNSNGGHGVSIEGVDISIEGVHVGVSTVGALAMGNAGAGVKVSGGDTALPATVGHSTGDAIMVVSGNALGGVWLDTHHAMVRHAIVGLDPTESVAVPNGSNPLGASGAFGGVLVTGVGPFASPGVSVTDNRIAGNDGHGIWLRGGDYAGIVHDADITDNVVGVDASGGALVNDGDGLHVEGASDILVQRNVIAGSTGHGVVLTDDAQLSTAGVQLIDNDIGDLGDSFGNGGHGVWLSRTGGQAGVMGNVVQDNRIHHSGQSGLFSSGGATENELTGNLVYANTMCPIRSDSDSNGGKGWPVPTIDAFDATSVSGTHAVRHRGTLDRIEVYEGLGFEAETFLGTVDGASVDPVTGAFTLSNVTVSATELGHLRALAIRDDGTTSALTPAIGDGCLSSTCIDENVAAFGSFNPCHFYHWDGTDCSNTTTRPDGYPCFDDDAATGAVYFGSTSGHDTCQSGVCVGGTALASPDDCTWASSCNIPSFDTGTNLCTYAPNCGDTGGYCGVDDLDTTAGSGCAACSECGDDIDDDGIPDTWENDPAAGPTFGYDHDCDPATSKLDLQQLAGADPTLRDVFLFVAWMSETCPAQLDDPPAAGATYHHHYPNPSRLSQMEDAFLEAQMVLHIETRCVPHVTQVNRASGHNRDPDCDALDDFAFYRDIKAAHFEPWRRGIYHFALMAHGFIDNDLTGWGQSDGLCAGGTLDGRSAEGEVNGDDLIVYDQHRNDRNANGEFAEPDHVFEAELLFHELGHLLGLEHGGDNSANYKPNYQSAMNYDYYTMQQSDPSDPLNPNVTVTVLDYSPEDEDDLDETSLVEDASTGVFTTKLVGKERLLAYNCPPGSGMHDAVFAAGNDIDWTCDGVIDPLPVDSNIGGGGGGGTTTLTGHHDWNAVDVGAACGEESSWQDFTLHDEGPQGVGAHAMQGVRIDLAPACADAGNPVSIDDDYPIDLVLFGSAAHPASTVALDTVLLAGGHARRTSITDHDGDGHDDLLVRFRPSSLTLLSTASSTALFNATTSDGVLLFARTAVDAGDYDDADGNGTIDPCDP